MDPNPDRPGFIPRHGNYKELLSYQKSEVEIAALDAESAEVLENIRALLA